MKPTEESAQGSYKKKLLDSRQKIISLFLKRVREKMPSAKNVDDSTLENSLFDFLTSIANFISFEFVSDDIEDFEQNIVTAREHGVSRAQIPSYTLDQVISEYRILRSIILYVLEDGSSLPSVERDNVFFAIDNGMTQAATEFAYNRGFKDARLTEEISAKKIAITEANDLKLERKHREQFFSAVTHDMRNPLSIAKASAEFIQRKASDPETVRRHADKIIKSIDRSNLMIKDLLDSNRLRSGGKLSVHKEDCDLSTLIKETCDDLSRVYRDQLKVEPLPSVKGKFDCTGLKRALENLITNGMKYGTEGGTVTVSLSKMNTEVCICVHNEGNPIPLKDQASLFEHYHRAQAQKGTQEGWGIGLTLVQGMAEAHDGKVEVKSSIDKGTTFSIILPLL